MGQNSIYKIIDDNEYIFEVFDSIDLKKWFDVKDWIYEKYLIHTFDLKNANRYKYYVYSDGTVIKYKVNSGITRKIKTYNIEIE